MLAATASPVHSAPREESVVSAENRLTPEQLAALRPGETVIVESGAEFGRRRHATATVVHVNASHVVVCCESSSGREVR